MEKLREKQPLFTAPRIPFSAEVGCRKTPAGGRTFSYPTLDGNSIENLPLAEIARFVNYAINPARIEPYVQAFKQCTTSRDFKLAEQRKNAELGTELGTSFRTRFLFFLVRNGILGSESAPAALQAEGLYFLTNTYIRSRYLVDTVFSNFSRTGWEEEFLARRNSKSKSERPYTLVEFFTEKCTAAFETQPLKNYFSAIELRKDPTAKEEWKNNLVKNFTDGMMHMPHLKNLATSEADLRKRVRQLMHVNAATRLFSPLVASHDGYAYFQKPLADFLQEVPNSSNIYLNIACEPEAVLQSTRGQIPSRTCPMHYAPTDTFNGLIELMLKYPEYTPKTSRVFEMLFD